MKRSPLSRRAPLSRRTHRPARSDAERAASADFHAATVSRGCEACRLRGDICEGRVEAHHVIPQQTLRRRGHADELWNEWNGMGLCYRAHRRHTNRVQPIERSLVPGLAVIFAHSVGCDDVLLRLYPSD